MSDPIEYQIKGIEILEFSVTEQKDKLNADLTYGFGFTLDHSLDIETKTISVTCSLKISDAAASIQFASLKAACIYELTDFLSYVKTAPVKISFPESFLQSINSVTLSTIRGIAFSYFKGTFLHNAILPIIDVSELQPMAGNEPK
ncbi:MAG: hypothetical protein IPH28_15755 [Cytophagaceae bacterium]|nr:hypothetical protein [Cytophagaceae bacterium]